MKSCLTRDQEGNTEYFYDRYGRIVASKNPNQGDVNKYSYTLYDTQGRPRQVGQVEQTAILTDAILKADDLGASFENWLGNNRSEVTITIYDEVLSPVIESQFTNGQNNLRLRVASILYFDDFHPINTNIQTDYTTATHYSYDLHGNVTETIQDVPMLAPVAQDQKKTEYEFELISGNMKAVHYQKDEIDGYTHFYHYDELNRLKEVETTTDNDVHRSTEARYQYYDYGPLARVELGEYQVQGMDYAYTINGWIKGMNSNTLDPGRDMGKDSRIGYLAQNQKVHLNFAKDVFGFTVNYFNEDYKAVGGSSFEADYSGTALGNYNQDLFNGNIRHVVTAIEGMEIQGYGYKYDQLQRIKEMQVFKDNNLVANNKWNTSQATNDYLTKFSYDKNGNLLTLNRNGYGTELDMDRFRYRYLMINGERSNRLDFVGDTGTDYASYEDIKSGQASGNYTYNRIGELTEDVQENMILEWRYGDHKLQKIERTDVDSPEVEFFYNPLGVRVGKLVKPRQGGVLEPQENWTMYYYAYDANGQLMSVYDSKIYAQNGETILEEQYIYGMDRIGSIQKGLLVFDNNAIAPSNDPYVENTLGQKRYELKNYLGTVNVTISDRKTYNSLDDAFEATVTNYAETYAFGMLMPNRSLNADGQRHLYHGMEQDMEVSGSGNSYTSEFRQYDPRLGRWKSLDALMYMFPHLSPYVGFDNNPIYFVDPYGLASEVVNGGGEPEGGDVEISKGDYLKDEEGNFILDENGNKQKFTYGDANIKPSFEQKIKSIRKELMKTYLLENMFGNLKSNKKDVDNWFFSTMHFLDEIIKGDGDDSGFVKGGSKLSTSEAKNPDNAAVKANSSHTIDADWFTVTRGFNTKVPTWSSRMEEIQNILDGIQSIQDAAEEYKEEVVKPPFGVSPDNNELERQSIDKSRRETKTTIRVIKSQDTIYSGNLRPGQKLDELGGKTVEEVSFDIYKKENN